MSADRLVRPRGVIEIRHAATTLSYSIAELIAVELGGEPKMITVDAADGKEHVAVHVPGRHPVSCTWTGRAMTDDRIAIYARQIARAVRVPDEHHGLASFRSTFEMNGVDGRHAFARASWRRRKAKGKGDAGAGG